MNFFQTLTISAKRLINSECMGVLLFPSNVLYYVMNSWQTIIIFEYREKLQILTLVPDMWSQENISKILYILEYLVRKALKLKLADGLLATRRKKPGKS